MSDFIYQLEKNTQTFGSRRLMPLLSNRGMTGCSLFPKEENVVNCGSADVVF